MKNTGWLFPAARGAEPGSPELLPPGFLFSCPYATGGPLSVQRLPAPPRGTPRYEAARLRRGERRAPGARQVDHPLLPTRGPSAGPRSRAETDPPLSTTKRRHHTNPSERGKEVSRKGGT